MVTKLKFSENLLSGNNYLPLKSEKKTYELVKFPKNGPKLKQLVIFTRNSRTFIFKTQAIIENSTFRKNKFLELPEKVRNDKPTLHT